MEELNSSLELLTRTYEEMITSLEKERKGKAAVEMKKIKDKIKSLRHAFEKDIQKLTELQMKGWRVLASEEKLAG